MSKLIKWYCLEEILKIQAQYYIIFGERSNGKSYSVGKMFLDDFFKYGKEFVIMKRYSEDMKTITCNTYFEPLYQYVLEEYGYRIKFYRGTWWAYEDGLEGKLSECKPIGYALALSTSDRAKGAQFPRADNILLEEFMSMGAIYLPNEINLFVNIVSTIVRSRTECKIFMLGNAISKYSPYSDALDIKFHRMKKGEILYKEYYDESGLKTTFAIERTENVDVFNNVANKEGICYNIFGNSGVGSMIRTGDFETNKYNNVVCNVTFSESLNTLPKGSYRIVNNKDRINVLIAYTDYIYAIYRIFNNNEIVYAFREIDPRSLNNSNKYQYMINNKRHYNGIVNIVNLNSYSDKVIDPILDELIHAYKQDKLLFLNNDNGEDINSAFNMCL